MANKDTNQSSCGWTGRKLSGDEIISQYFQDKAFGLWGGRENARVVIVCGYCVLHVWLLSEVIVYYMSGYYVRLLYLVIVCGYCVSHVQSVYKDLK